MQLGNVESYTYNPQGMREDACKIDLADDSPESQVSKSVEYKMDMEKILATFQSVCRDKRAVSIIKYRHFNNGEPKTWREIGSIFGFTYERARQIYNESMQLVRKAIQDDETTRSENFAKTS